MYIHELDENAPVAGIDRTLINELILEQVISLVNLKHLIESNCKSKAEAINKVAPIIYSYETKEERARVLWSCVFISLMKVENIRFVFNLFGVTPEDAFPQLNNNMDTAEQSIIE